MFPGCGLGTGTVKIHEVATSPRTLSPAILRRFASAITGSHSSLVDTTIVTRDDSKDCYAGANGWQFSDDKTQILLCGTACSALQSDLGARVNVTFGCATVTR